jgi:O-antigen/teichoic acid export membrane protein
MSLAKSALIGTGWLTFGQYASSAISILGNIWLARIIGPEPFGIFFFVSSLSEMLFLIGSFSFPQYIVQGRIITRRHYRAVILFSSALCLILIALATALAWLLSDQYTVPVLILFLLLSTCRAIWTLSLIFNYMLERAMHYGILSASRVSAAATGVAVSLFIAYRGGESWSLLGRECGMVMVGTLIPWIASRRISPFSHEVTEGSAYRDVWTFGFRLSGVQLLEQAFHRIDGVLLGRLLGLDRTLELGYYAQAKYFANLPILVADPGSRTVAYRVYAILEGDRKKLWKTLDLMQFWTLRAVLPICLVFVLLHEAIFYWTVGPEWVRAGNVLQALAFCSLSLVLFNNLKMLRLVLQDWNQLYWAFGLQLMAFLLGAAIATPLFGIVGAAVAYLIANLVGLGVIAQRADSSSGIILQIQGVMYPLLAAVLTCCVAYLVLSPSESPLDLIVNSAYVLCIYAALWWALEWKVVARSFQEIKGFVWAHGNA